jgi:hypothetical protein
MEVNDQLHVPTPFTPRETSPGAHCIREWVHPTAGLVGMEKSVLPLPGIEHRFFHLVAYSVCRLRYLQNERRVTPVLIRSVNINYLLHKPRKCKTK